MQSLGFVDVYQGLLLWLFKGGFKVSSGIVFHDVEAVLVLTLKF